MIGEIENEINTNSLANEAKILQEDKAIEKENEELEVVTDIPVIILEL